MIHIFILGYNRAEYFSQWFHQVNNAQPFQHNKKFYYIDNGQQEYTDPFLNSILLHKTEHNIFCSGGWNLICDIAFQVMELDKIIIGQEDAVFTDEILDEINLLTTPNQICGTYDRSFEFSLFGIHKDIFQKVGRFDENFFITGCEDNDYKHRCKLLGINIHSLNVSANYNESSTSGPQRSSTNNGEYLTQKWGELNITDNTIYQLTTPFGGLKNPQYIRPEYKTYFPGIDIDGFRSLYELNNYKNKIK